MSEYQRILVVVRMIQSGQKSHSIGGVTLRKIGDFAARALRQRWGCRR